MESSSLGAIVTWVNRPGGPGPLHGLRVGVKDVIAVQGVPRLCGAPGVVDAAPQARDATCVARLAADGAAIVATTATHQLSYGVTTPGVQNPIAPGLIAGGSSGGSAAALAAGIVDGALGTDTAGSVRIPAACCGVAALKTSEGLIPRDGVQPLSPSLDTVGPMARDVATLTSMLASLTSAPVAVRLPSPLRIGIVEEAWNGPVDERVREAWDAVVRRARDAGATIRTMSVPQWAESHRVAGRIVASEAAALHRETLQRHADRLAPDVRAALESGASLTNDKVLDARRTAALLRDRLVGVFAEVDVLVLPVLPCAVPAAGAATVTVAGREESVTSALTRMVDMANVAGICAGAVPVPGVGGPGPPFSAQVVGRWRAEGTVLAVMDLLEQLSR